MVKTDTEQILQVATELLRNRNRVFMVDVDHTLLDTGKVKQAILGLLEEHAAITEEDFANAVIAVRDEKGFYTVAQVVEQVIEAVGHPIDPAQVADSIFALPFDSYYYDGAAQAVKKLEQYGEVAIFTQGEEAFQLRKVSPLLADGIITREQVIVHQDKASIVKETVTKYADKTIVVFDDHQRFLLEFAKAHPHVVTCLIETQENHADQVTSTPFSPTLWSPSLTQAVATIEEIITQ